MPLLIAVFAAVLLMVPASTPAQAHHSNAAAHSQDFAMKQKAKKSKRPKAKKEEYMRAAPYR